MAEQLTLVTGKTWSRTFQRQNAAGEPIPFAATDTFRAQMRETPGGPKICDITVTITSRELAAGTVSLTDEQTALIPTARLFNSVRVMYFDVDVLTEGGEVQEMIVNEKVLVKAGVTEATS